MRKGLSYIRESAMLFHISSPTGQGPFPPLTHSPTHPQSIKNPSLERKVTTLSAAPVPVPQLLFPHTKYLLRILFPRGFYSRSTNQRIHAYESEGLDCLLTHGLCTRTPLSVSQIQSSIIHPALSPTPCAYVSKLSLQGSLFIKRYPRRPKSRSACF